MGKTYQGHATPMILLVIICMCAYIYIYIHIIICRSSRKERQTKTQWIGLRENLQETIDFPIKYGVFL